MLMSIVAKLRGHETPISFNDERAAVLDWVLDNLTEIESLEISCNVNRWHWTAAIGWIQYPQIKYISGEGIVPFEGKPRVRGNGPDAINPWRYSAHRLPERNPMYLLEPTF